MAAFTTTPTEAGEGPSLIGIAKSIGTKIRDAAENAKEEREKAQEAGETPKKGSLFKSSLANQFNPIKSKKAKSNWAKQFSWNKPKDKPVTPPTQADGVEGSAKLKEFIAGGFTAILKDTGVMVSKLGGINDGIGQNLAATTSSSGTLTAIKETLDAQTDLRRKALEEAKYARAEKQLEKTQDTSSSRSPFDTTEKDKSDGEGGDDGGGGPFDWMLNLLGLGDLASNFIPDKWLQKLNPFKKSPVTQGGGGKPPGPRMPGSGPRVTTSGGVPAPAAKQPWWKKMLPFADDAAKGAAEAGAKKGAGGLLGRLLPGAQQALAVGLAGKALSEGDMIGALLSGGSGIPLGGYAFLGMDMLRNFVGKDFFDKSYGQALSGDLGLSDAEIEKRNKTMTGLEKGLLSMGSPSLFSEGGIVPSAVPPSPVSPMAQGGVVDNPTKTNLNPGDSVIPLNRNVGKKMFGGAKDTSAGETAVDTVGAMILGVASGMLGKTESGTAGDMVKQDIRKASKQFGISNLTFTSSIGKGNFGKVDMQKDSKNFLISLFENMSLFGSGGGGGGGNQQQQQQQQNPPGGGADLGASMVPGETIQAQGAADPGGFIQGGSGLGSEGGQNTNKGYATHWHLSPPSNDPAGWQQARDVAFTSAQAMLQRGSTIYFGNLKQYASSDPATLKQQISAEQQAHTQSGRTQGGIDMQEKAPDGNMALKFPLKVTNVSQDISGGSGRTARIIGTNVRLAHGAAGSANSVETQAMPNPSNVAGAPAGGQQASGLPQGQVSPIFDWKERGGMLKAQDGGAWWNPFSWGKLVNNQRNTNSGLGYNARYKDVTDPEMRRMMGLPPLKGYASGGPMDSRHAHAAKLKAKRASEQRSRLGVQKVNGKWVNMGVSDRAVGGNPWWQVWNKKGATSERKQKQEALAKSLADRLNKQEAAKVKPQAPKPRPAPPAAPASGVGPAPSTSGSRAQAATVVTPPVQSSANQSYTGGTFGGNVPSGKSMASTFADFLYTDLIE